MRLPEPPLLVISDRSQAVRPLAAIAEAVFAGGCRWFSLREKDLPAQERRELLAALDVETIIPGHGPPCGKAYLKEQAQIVENWIGFVETRLDRGKGPDEILKEGVPVTAQDPYPIGQRLFMHDERLTSLIVHNLHRRLLGKKEAAGTRAG